MSDPQKPAEVYPEPTPERTHDEPVAGSLATFMGQDWAPAPDVTPERHAVAQYAAERRRRLSEAFPDDLIVIGSGSLKVRANDTDYPFRPDSDFYWLTGCTDPDSYLIMTPRPGGHEAVLYVPDRSDRNTSAFYADPRYGELWVGPRNGVRETAAMLDIKCRPATEVPENLRVGTADSKVLRALSEMRLLKDEYELSRLQEAIDSTVVGFNECIAELGRAREFARGERWLEGTFDRRARLDGNDVGYSSIVAASHHAATLHWTRNDGLIRDGDLLLMDMGVESDSLYTADITRTVPISGTFSAAQRQVYEVVLAAQQAAIEVTKPGASFLDPHRAAMRVCATALHEWGLLPVSVDEALSEDKGAAGAGLYRRYTLHGTSHMLGLDVHDCAHARNEHYRDGRLAENTVFTIEPGLYFQPGDLKVPAELRSIGVRIEDDIVVTATGSRNMSEALPRAVADVERWVRSG